MYIFVKLVPRDLNLDSYFLYFTSTYTCREFLIKGLFGYRLLLKTENSKYYSNIIFKCVNSAMRLNFKIIFVEKSTCGSHEQCMRPA